MFTSFHPQRKSLVNHAHHSYDEKIVDNARIYCLNDFLNDGEVDIDGGIDIFDLNTGAFLKTLPELGWVRSFTIVDQNLITVPLRERTINTYCIETGERLNSRPAPDDWVSYSAIPGGRILSYHSTPIIKIWDAQDLTLLHTLEHIPALAISSMHFTRDELICGCEDGQIWVANLHTNQFSAFVGHDRAIKALAVGGGRLVSSTHDYVKLWDIATGECLRTLDLREEGGAASLAIEEGFLFIGSCVPTIKIYALETGEHLGTQEAIQQKGQVLTVYREPALYLTFAGRKLILESERGKIQVRNYQVENAQVFREIAQRFNESTFEPTQEGFERFVRMPQRQKDGIYAELAKILRLAPNTPLPTLEEIFIDQSEVRIISDKDRVQAIENYLTKEGSRP